MTDLDKLRHACHDLVEAQADLRNLKSMMRVLLTDAKDAYEIGEPDFAYRRVITALRNLDKE